MADNPMDALRRLRERLEQVTGPIGLRLERFLPEPTTDGPDVVTAIFVIDIEDVGKDAEQAEFDAQFESLTKGLEGSIERQSLDERAEQARLDLQKMLEQRHGGGGFLGPEPPQPA